MRAHSEMRSNKLLYGGIAGAAIAGILIGFLLRPAIAPDSRIGELEDKLTESDKSVGLLKARAEGLDKDLEKAATTKKDLETQLTAAKKAEAERTDTAADAAAAQKKD